LGSKQSLVRSVGLQRICRGVVQYNVLRLGEEIDILKCLVVVVYMISMGVSLVIYGIRSMYYYKESVFAVD